MQPAYNVREKKRVWSPLPPPPPPSPPPSSVPSFIAHCSSCSEDCLTADHAGGTAGQVSELQVRGVAGGRGGKKFEDAVGDWRQPIPPPAQPQCRL
eukprot:202253-Hanusia_phi.AAC.1